MDEVQYQELGAKLDTIIRLLAAPLIKDRPIAESAPILSGMGIDNAQIALICKTSGNVVRTALLRAKRRK